MKQFSNILFALTSITMITSSSATACEDALKITVTKSAAETGILRLWLSETPDLSDTVFAFRTTPDGIEDAPVASAKVYGRGKGSNAIERFMLQLRNSKDSQLPPMIEGETLQLFTKSYDDEDYQKAEFEILEVE